MPNTTLAVHRLPHRLKRDPSRTIARFFWPPSPQRARSIVSRVIRLGPETVSRLLESIMRDFGDRYEDLLGIFDDHYGEARERISFSHEPTPDQAHLIGAYFTMEYAYASAAFFNPSMVPAIDQSGLAEGSTRFIMSLRAVGEGHISSIVFRRGVLDRDCSITFDPVPLRSRRLRVVEDRTFPKERFLQKLIESGAYTDLTGVVLGKVGERFTFSELTEAIESAYVSLGNQAGLTEAVDRMMWLARSNYQVKAPPGAELSELVIFPISENESNGIEDMRLVRFVDDDGSVHYYGTYTAFNGAVMLPQLMELRDDQTVEVHTMSGHYAVDKGMALFPRRIDGWYAMIARFDGKNLYLVTSDNVRFWNEAVRIQEPRYPWEFVQIGNCGSPLETDAGWLLITHGVGPMRRYAIGASLLDRDDPTKVLGRLAEPLLLPLAEERSGYVPNVVYSCGSMIHNDTLVIPYGISDVETGFATVSLPDLLGRLCG
ncbi:MAG: glycoside hydrolase family 130 protein [Planctomycetota bacterium]|jgi:predicted GH43/DUF377 family glycosyl hydrolase